ncbi:MAG: hypothetical protein C0404_01230 [Verrucomicrobia bacterium]|nr:hypothetical protein [Verrucomicrobiota bacterium]
MLIYQFLPGAVALLIVAGSAAGEDTNKTASASRPLVVMKQAEIAGKVFFLQEDEEGNSGKSPLKTKKGIKIKVLSQDQSTTIFKTETDENGSYTLPNLDVGKFKLLVGRLLLDLRVEDAQDNPKKMKELAKTLHIFIPEALKE